MTQTAMDNLMTAMYCQPRDPSGRSPLLLWLSYGRGPGPEPVMTYDHRQTAWTILVCQDVGQPMDGPGSPLKRRTRCWNLQ